MRQHLSNVRWSTKTPLFCVIGNAQEFAVGCSCVPVKRIFAAMSALLVAFVAMADEKGALPAAGHDEGSAHQLNAHNPEFVLTATPHSQAALKALVNRGSTMVDQLEAVHSLTRNLSATDIATLYVYLESPSICSQDEMPILYAVRNDILNVLRNQSTAPAGLTDRLIAIYDNTTADYVLRDYAVQHLVAWYEQGAADSADSKQKIQNLLKRAASASDSIAGTALLGMHRLSARDANFSKEEIDHLALTQARNSTMSVPSRITAIQVCAERGLKDVVPAIELLPKEAGSFPLRLSAIAALGQLGAEQDSTALRQIEAEQGDDLGAALRTALRRIEQKEQVEKIY